MMERKKAQPKSKPEKIELPKMTNCVDLEGFDFRKAKGRMWVRYKEECFNHPRLYPDLHNGDLLLVDFADRDVNKGSLFLLRLPDGKWSSFAIRLVRLEPRHFPFGKGIVVVDHSVFPVTLFDLRKQRNPILGRVLYSVRNWSYIDSVPNVV